MTPKEVKAVIESKEYPDHLSHIFAIQGAFADLCFSNNDIRDSSGEFVTCKKVAEDAVQLRHGYNELFVKWTWEMLRALKDECRELEDLLPWKHWSKTQMGEKEHPEATQKERLNHLRLELVDQIHFIVEALIFSGMTAESAYQLYIEKNKVNIARQEQNYNDARKTEDDNNAVASRFR